VQLCDKSTPDGVPFPARFSLLQEPLLAVAQEAERACLRSTPGTDEEQDGTEIDDELPEDAVSVKVVQYSRNLQCLRDTLLEGESLAACRKALCDCGLSSELPSGAKIFVHPEHYEPVLAAIKSAELVLKPFHVIVSDDFEDLVTAATSSLPSRAQVREKASFSVHCPPVCEACMAQNPRFKCSQCGKAMYCSRACQKNHWQTHVGLCETDDALSIVKTTFIHVDLPSSLRSAPSSRAKTASTSDANPRIKTKPRYSARRMQKAAK